MFTSAMARCVGATAVTVAVFAGTTLAAPVKFVALTADNRVEMFDAAGTFLESRAFGAPTNIVGASRLSIAYGDVLASNPGNEVVVLRDVENSLIGIVDIYPDPTITVGALDRLFSAQLQNVGNREPLSIDIADLDANNPGPEIVALVRDPSINPQQPFVHVYGALPAVSGGIINRVNSGFVNLTASAHEPLAAIAVGELATGLAGLEVATTAENFWNEVFTFTALGAAATRTDVFQTGAGVETIGLKTDGLSLVVLARPAGADADQRYRLDTLVPLNTTGDLTFSNTLRLQNNPAGQSQFVDFIVVPEPGSAGLIGVGAMMLFARRR